MAALLGLAAAAGLAEGLVRVLAPQSVAVPWQDEVGGITAPRPNVRGRHAIPDTFDVTVSFNGQRFRATREYQSEPGPGVLRIAVLGDSFTFGFGANDEETYPAQLERVLIQRARERGEHVAVEVLNAGNGGTGTGEQALWYDRWVKDFHPVVVILTVTSNDVEDDLNRRLFVQGEDGSVTPRPRHELEGADSRLRWIRTVVNAMPGYGFLAQHSQLLGLARNAVSKLLTRWRAAAWVQADSPSVEQGGGQDAWHDGLAVLKGELRWLHRAAQEAGAQLVVVFVPSRESIYASPRPWAGSVQAKSRDIVGALSETALQEGIPFADLTPYVRDRAGQLEPQLYYDGRDTHPNPLGYRVIAEGVADLVVRPAGRVP